MEEKEEVQVEREEQRQEKVPSAPESNAVYDRLLQQLAERERQLSRLRKVLRKYRERSKSVESQEAQPVSSTKTEVETKPKGIKRVRDRVL